MNGSTHLIGGLAAGLIVASAMPTDNTHTVIGVLLAVAAALLPDRVQYTVEHVRLPLEGHRSGSHTLLFALLTALAFRPELAVFWLSGLLSHYILDLPSRQGLPLLWPIVPGRLGLGWFQNGSVGEVVTRLALIALCAGIALRWTAGV